LLERAAAYAETVALAWDVSERAKRRAGCCRYDADTGQLTIVLTWDAYCEFGWQEFTATIRHELVHAWEFQRFGEFGHGERFRRMAAQVDAPRHCRTFTDGRLELVCTADTTGYNFVEYFDTTGCRKSPRDYSRQYDDCDWRPERHRASKPVRTPDAGYRCGECGSRYVVHHGASGRTWRTNAGYEQAREALGEDW
jgi:predicted SprT family Zn-dependent metalloprotease